MIIRSFILMIIGIILSLSAVLWGNISLDNSTTLLYPGILFGVGVAIMIVALKLQDNEHKDYF